MIVTAGPLNGPASGVRSGLQLYEQAPAQSRGRKSSKGGIREAEAGRAHWREAVFSLRSFNMGQKCWGVEYFS